jgi:hypothetical protein
VSELDVERLARALLRAKGIQRSLDQRPPRVQEWYRAKAERLAAEYGVAEPVNRDGT